MARLHVWIEGLVQGVAFRYSTQRAARALGLAGWVRNLPDGRVEAVFEGPRDTCAKALAYVRRGPRPAHVERVQETWEEEEERLTGFEVRF